MKNKSEKPIKEVEIPELKVPQIFTKIIDCISHVPYIYWILLFLFALALLAKLMPSQIWLTILAGIKANKALVVMLSVFCVVAISLLWSVGQRIDVWIFMFFNMHGHRAPWLDGLMLTLTQLGNFFFAIVVALILFFIGNHLLAYELILGVITLGLFIELIKLIIRRMRPYMKLKSIRIVGARASGRSFPSGHTGQSFFIASLLVHYYHVNILVWLIMYTIALIVGITRIYVGMHYPRDVVGGAILGTAWGIVGMIVNSYIQ